MKLDPAVLNALPPDIDPAKTTITSHGGSGFSSTAKISATMPNGSQKLWFMKTARGKDAEVMFAGEHASLNALQAVDGLCPGLSETLVLMLSD